MSEPLKLLLVEDNDDDVILLLRELRKANFDVDLTQVQTSEAFYRELSTNDWDAIISDYNLPAFSAPKALEILKKSKKELPFIVVSGAIGEETAVIIMRAGAHDYFVKGKLNRLAEALRREIRDAGVRAERVKAENALRESEEQLRLLFEQSSDAIFLLDRQTGQYLGANKAAEKLTARPAAGMVELSSHEITSYDFVQHLQSTIKTSGPTSVGKVVFNQPGGAQRIAEVTLLPINSSRIYAIAHDITEQLMTEDVLRNRAHELESLYLTSLKINAQVELIPLLETIVEQAASLLKSRMGGLYLVRPEENVLELVVSYNLPGALTGTLLKMGEGLSGFIAQTGETMMVSDYQAWAGLAGVYKGYPFRRVVGAPMKVKGQVIGVINVTDDQKTGSYTPDEIRLVSMFADQAAIAVENTRLLTTIQHELNERTQAEKNLHLRVKELTLLHDIAHQIMQANTIDNLITGVTEAIGQSFYAADYGILLLDESQTHLKPHASYFGIMLDSPNKIPLEACLCGLAVSERRAIRYGDVTQAPRYFEAASGIHSELSVPIKVGENILGVLNAEARESNLYTADDERLFGTIAGQIGTAIERIRLFEGLENSFQDLNQAYESTIEGWSRAMDLRDKETEGHTLRVTKTTIRLAEILGIKGEALIHIRYGALLHDIGKLGVPDRILLKPDALTAEEWVIMRRHPLYAYEMLSPVDYLRPSLDIPYRHHEKWDGSGYPDGLKGEEIPLAARLFAVVDVWDALTSDRPYRPAWSALETRAYLEAASGRQFDPYVVQKFLEIVTE